MENTEIERKRHVEGLRLAVWLSVGLNFFVLLTSILGSGGWTSELASKLWLINVIVGTTIFLSVAIFLNNKNYIYLLTIVVCWFVVGPWIRAFAFGLDDQVVGYFRTYGGRLIDWRFIATTYTMILIVLLGRFYLTIFFVIYYLALNAFFSSSIILRPETYFTYDHSKISSDLFAMHGAIYQQNVTVVIISALALIGIAWRMQKNLKDASLHERSNSILGRYFSPEVREEIEKNKATLGLDKEKEQKIAVMFTDISGFTKLSEGMKPKDVLDLLSEYQTKMVAAIFHNGGTVDKFIGDSVMATFGTPFSKGNDSQNALNCLRQMQISMREWAQERKEKGLPVVKHRIGVHFGECFVGNVGSEDRFEYTVIGDTVNVANRICEGCKDVGADVLISEEVMSRLSENLTSEKVVDFSVRGRSKKIKLHKIVV